jgi:hypothetical protein
MTRNVRIDYTIKPDVALEDVKEAISEFVAGIASHHPDHRYVSFQYAEDPRRFVHVGEIVEERLKTSKLRHSSRNSPNPSERTALAVQKLRS